MNGSNGAAARDHIIFYLNGRERVVRGVQPEMTVLQYVRQQGLTGTKLGCGEGGCGACTVMVSSYDHEAKEIRHAAVNACLAPLCSVDSCHVTTVEGIGSMRRGLHPVQQRIAAMHGSQCGFCTPGIVMALYALLRSNPKATKDFVEENLDGNLCRCTGYRPILDAAKSLASDGRVGCCRGASGGGGGCPCASAKVDGSATDDSDAEDEAAGGTAVVPAGLAGMAGRREVAECSGSRAREARFAAPYSDVAEPIFPPTLMLQRPPPLAVHGRAASWYAPTTLESLLALKAEHPTARLVVGNTEVGIETKFKNVAVPVIICPSRVPEMSRIESSAAGLSIGGAATLAALERVLEKEIHARPRHETAGFRAASSMLRWFASNQIRNVAALAGNLATASPISDMNPLLAACGSVLTLASRDGGKREVAVRDFFLGYRRVDLLPTEVILSVSFPVTRHHEFVLPCKQARRREDDISIVTAGIRLLLEPGSRGGSTAGSNGSSATSSCWVVKEASMGFGGLAPTTVLARKTADFLAGKEWCEETLEGAYALLAEEFDLPVDVPGGQSEFRRALVPSFLFKCFVATSIELEEVCGAAAMAGAEPLPAPPVIKAAERSAARSFVTEPKPPSRGQQTYVMQTDGGLQRARPVPHEPDPEAGGQRAPVGKPIMHKAGPMQVTGEAEYTDDIPSPPGTLHAALVMSTRPHARLLSIDAGAALAHEGVRDFFTSRDVPGDNAIGAVVKDEEAFATSEVVCVGQVIGILVADTLEQAQAAAKLVQIEYEDLPAVLSIEDAIAADPPSFFDQFHVIEDGDVDAALTADGVVTVEGEMKIGSQEHFYLETNATLAVPTEGGGLEVFASTQAPTKTQAFCAHVCGIPSSRVVCRVKRMGGGFGGKETRSVFISVVVGLAAHLTGRPVRLQLDRDVDMQITGQRHAFYAKYKAGAYKDGRLAGLDVKLYDNIGCSLDLSGAVTDRALFHVDNCCRWPTLRCRGFMAKTNQSSHTAYRGFGAPQGMLVCEVVLDHLAAKLGMAVDTLRDANMYVEGQLTHFHMPIERWNVPAALKELRETADIDARRAAIATFNAENRWRKRGLAVMPTKFGISFTAKFMNQGGALVHLYTDGTVLVSHGGTEMGQGLHTKVIQVAARSFGIHEDQVHIAETSTDKVPNSSPTAASMSTDLYGMATLDACEQIKERLRPVAEKMPGADLRAVAQAAYMQRVNLSAQGFYCVPSKRCGYDWSASVEKNAEGGQQPFNYFTQGVAASEVEIDVLTGDVRVLRADIVMDLGASINPAIDIGQIEGAFIQGYGWCTMEEVVWGDAEHKWVRPGQMLTRGPGAYKLPAFNDVPSDLRVRLMANVDNPFAVHSSKAVGEPPFFLAASAFFAIKEAIRSARVDAGASPVFELYSPASSERIRTACADRFVQKFTGSGAFQARGSW